MSFYLIGFMFFLFGLLGGFFTHALMIKINFKQRTIENKIRAYDGMITAWAKMRNHFYAEFKYSKEWLPQLEKMYGESQAYIGEIFLVSENAHLVEDINIFNEKLYKQDWLKLSQNMQLANDSFERLKLEALKIISRMRADIEGSTVLSGRDIVHILKNLFSICKKSY